MTRWRGRSEVPGAINRQRAALPFFKRPAVLYVDGFNLHHALLEFRRPEWLWLDLHTLGRKLIAPDERLAGVVWVAAHRPHRRDEPLHLYEAALRARKVRCLMGHFVIHGDSCRACGHSWMTATEKQSDVNLAIAVAADAASGRAKSAYLLTTDGDQAATARFIKEGYPDMRVVSVAPPGRGHNRQILPWCDARTEIAPPMVDRSPLPDRIRTAKGWIERPDAWRARDPDPPPPPPPSREDGKPSHLRLVVSNS